MNRTKDLENNARTTALFNHMTHQCEVGEEAGDLKSADKTVWQTGRSLSRQMR
jgi:hypothetical protein